MNIPTLKASLTKVNKIVRESVRLLMVVERGKTELKSIPILSTAETPYDKRVQGLIDTLQTKVDSNTLMSVEHNLAVEIYDTLYELNSGEDETEKPDQE